MQVLSKFTLFKFSIAQCVKKICIVQFEKNHTNPSSALFKSALIKDLLYFGTHLQNYRILLQRVPA